MIQNRAPRSELRCIESELASSEAPKQYIARSSERCQAGLTLDLRWPKSGLHWRPLAAASETLSERESEHPSLDAKTAFRKRS